MNIKLLLEIFNVYEIFDLDEIRKIVLRFINKPEFIEYLNNINYRAFNHIQNENDLSKITVNDIINFSVDNRYGFLKNFNFKEEQISKVELLKIIKISNIKSWFNLFKVMELYQSKDIQSLIKN